MNLLLNVSAVGQAREFSLNLSRSASHQLNSMSPSPQGAVTWLEDVKFIMMGVVGPLLEISGLITSALSIVLLNLDRSIQASVRIILVALAVADILFLFGAIFCVQLEIFAVKFSIGNLQAFRNTFIQSSSCSVVNVAEMFRNWLTVLIGIERFIATNFPLTAKRLCSRRRIWLATVIIFIGAVLLRVPYAYRRWLRGSVTLTKTEQKLAEFALTLHTNIDSFGLVIIPLIILTIVSALIIRKIKISQVLHADMRDGVSRSNTTANSSMRKNSRVADEEEQQPMNPSSRASGCNSYCNYDFKLDTLPIQTQSSVRRSSTQNGYAVNLNSRVFLSPSTNLQTSPVRSYMHQRSASVHIQKRNQVANMLLFILLLFALFGIPQIIFVILEYYGASKWVRGLMVIVVWSCSMIYSNTNFFVYIAYMPKYRTMLKIVICNCAFTHHRWRKFHIKQTRKRSMSASVCDTTCVELNGTVNRSSFQSSCSLKQSAKRCISVTLRNNNAAASMWSSDLAPVSEKVAKDSSPADNSTTSSLPAEQEHELPLESSPEVELIKPVRMRARIDEKKLEVST